MDFTNHDSRSDTPPDDDWEPIKTAIVKAGGVGLLMGVGICIGGAILLSQANHNIAVVGDWVHKGGMLVMLAGMLVVLGGLRSKQIYQGVRAMMGENARPSSSDPFADRIESLTTPTVPVPRQLASFQFSLATLMAFFVGVSFSCGMIFALPIAFSALLFFVISLLMLVGFVTAIVYGHGSFRTFSIGATVSLGFEFFNLSSTWGFGMILTGFGGGRFASQSDELLIRIFMLGIWVVAFGAGILAVIVRRIVDRNGQSGVR